MRASGSSLLGAILALTLTPKPQRRFMIDDTLRQMQEDMWFVAGCCLYTLGMNELLVYNNSFGQPGNLSLP